MTANEVREAMESLETDKTAFAAKLAVSVRTVEGWLQGRRVGGLARTVIRIHVANHKSRKKELQLLQPNR